MIRIILSQGNILLIPWHPMGGHGAALDFCHNDKPLKKTGREWMKTIRDGHRSTSIAQRLLQQNVDVNTNDIAGKIRLLITTEPSLCPMVTFFVENCANVRAKTVNPITPLHIVSTRVCLPLVQFFAPQRCQRQRERFALESATRLCIVDFSM